MKFIKCNAMTRIMSNNKETMSLTMDHMKRSSYLRRFTVTALITLLMICQGGLSNAKAETVRKVVTATLDHTAGAQWGSNTGASTVDAELEHYNNDAETAWAGCAYAQFSYELPEGATVTKAELVYYVKQGNKTARDEKIYYMNKGFSLDYNTFAGQTGTDLRNTSNRSSSSVTLNTGGSGDRGPLTANVTDFVKAIAENGQDYIIFQWTGNAGGSDLYGKGSSTKAPVLNITIEYDCETYATPYLWKFSGVTTQDATLTYDDADTKTEASTSCRAITSPNWCLGLYVNDTWKSYKNNSGLRNISKGARMLLIPDLEKGDNIKVYCNNTDYITSTRYTGTTDVNKKIYSFVMEDDGNFYFNLDKVNNNTSVYPQIDSIKVIRELTNNVTVTFKKDDIDSDIKGVVPEAVEIAAGKKLAFSKNTSLYKEGYTMTGWNDGSITYSLSDKAKIVDNTEFTTVFTQNTVVRSDIKVAATASFSDVAWTSTGTEVYHVAQATFDGESQDVPVIVNGKTFTIEAIKGMTITFPTGTIGDYSAEDMTVDGDTWTYTGNASYVTVTYNGDAASISTLTLVYPKTSKPVFDTDLSNSAHGLNIGESLTLTVSASAPAAVSYQWYSKPYGSEDEGTEIEGATSASYNVSGVAKSTTCYYCVATNIYGSATSSYDIVHVDDYITLDIKGLPSYDKQLGAEGTKGSVNCNGEKAANFVLYPYSLTGYLGWWGDMEILSNTGIKTIWNTSGGRPVILYDLAVGDVVTLTGTSLEAGDVVANGQNDRCVADISVNAAGTEITAFVKTAGHLQLNLKRQGANELQSIKTSNKYRPTITTDLSGETYVVAREDTKTLSVVASGENLTYQWYRNEVDSVKGGVLIPDAIEATYTTEPNKSYYYYCVVRNGNRGAGVVSKTSRVECKPQVSYVNNDADAIGDVPASEVIEIGGKFTIESRNYQLSKPGYTLTGWTDGTNTYEFGQSYDIVNDIVLNPVFRANEQSLSAITKVSTVTWPFATSKDAPAVNWTDGETHVLAAQQAVTGERQDFGAKVASAGFATGAATATVAEGTTIKIPMKYGTTIELFTSGETPSATVLTTDLKTPRNMTVDGSTLTYTYKGNNDELTMTLGAGAYDSLRVHYVPTGMPVFGKDLDAHYYLETGKEHTLNVDVSDGATIQWYRNTTHSNEGGTKIEDATSASYTVSSTTDKSEYYYVTITNNYGTVISTCAAVDYFTYKTLNFMTWDATDASDFSDGGGVLLKIPNGTNAAISLNKYLHPYGLAGYLAVQNTDVRIRDDKTDQGIVNFGNARYVAIPGLKKGQQVILTGCFDGNVWYTDGTKDGVAIEGAAKYNTSPGADNRTMTIDVLSDGAIVFLMAKDEKHANRIEIMQIPDKYAPVIVSDLKEIYVVDKDASLTMSLEAELAANIDGHALSYQWYETTNSKNKGGTAIAEATSAEYTIEKVNKSAYYYCLVTNTATGTITPTRAAAVGFYVSVGFENDDDDAYGEAPKPIKVPSGQPVTMPKNQTLIKDGYTLTGWTDGTTTTAIGEDYVPQKNVVLHPVFTKNTANVSLQKRSEEMTVRWVFATENGSAEYNNNASANVLQPIINGDAVDVGIKMTKGDNQANEAMASNGWMAANNGNFTLPVVKGARIALTVYYPTDITINGENITYNATYGEQGAVRYVYAYTGSEKEITLNIANNYIKDLEIYYPAPELLSTNAATYNVYIDNAKVARKSAVITLTGKNLEPGSTVTLTKDAKASNITIDSETFTVGSDGTLSQQILVTYEGTAAQAQDNTVLTFVYSEDTKATATVTYGREAAFTGTSGVTPVGIKTVWDWSSTASLINPAQDVYMAFKDIDLSEGQAWPEGFTAANLAGSGTYYANNISKCFEGKELYFETLCKGTIDVEFSAASGNNITLAVNGENTSFSSNSTNSVTAKKIPVGVGGVLLQAHTTGLTTGEQDMRIYKVTFTPDANKPVITPDKTTSSFTLAPSKNDIYPEGDPTEVLYYTTDGSEPSLTSASTKKYLGEPVSLYTNVMIKAMAVAPNKNNSDVDSVQTDMRTYKLNVGVYPANSGRVVATPMAENYEYTENATVTLKAEAASGYGLSAWATSRANIANDEFIHTGESSITVNVNTTSNEYWAVFKDGKTVTVIYDFTNCKFLEANGQESDSDLAGFMQDMFTDDEPQVDITHFKSPIVSNSIFVPRNYPVFVSEGEDVEAGSLLSLVYWEDQNGKRYEKGSNTVVNESDQTYRLRPVFQNNPGKTPLEERVSSYDITWDFRHSEYAHPLTLPAGVTSFYTRDAVMSYKENTTLFENQTVDIAIQIDTHGVTNTDGSFAEKAFTNEDDDEWASISKGTKITIPSSYGAKITLATYKPIIAGEGGTKINGIAPDNVYEENVKRDGEAYLYTWTIKDNATSVVLTIGDLDYAFYKYIHAEYPNTETTYFKLSSNNDVMGTVSAVNTLDENDHGTVSDLGLGFNRNSSVTLTAERNRFYELKYWITGKGTKFFPDGTYQRTTDNTPKPVGSFVNSDDITFTHVDENTVVFTLKRYFEIQAVFGPRESYTINFMSGTSSLAEGDALPVQYVEIGEKFDMPANNYNLYKEGYTLQYYISADSVDNPSARHYEFGKSYSVSNDMLLMPIFTANTKSVYDVADENGRTVTWNVNQMKFNFTSSNGRMVSQLAVDDNNTIDVQCYFANRSNNVYYRINSSGVLELSSAAKLQILSTSNCKFTVNAAAPAEFQKGSITIASDDQMQGASVSKDIKTTSSGQSIVFNSPATVQSISVKYNKIEKPRNLASVKVGETSLTEEQVATLNSTTTLTYDCAASDIYAAQGAMPTVTAEALIADAEKDKGVVDVTQATVDNPVATLYLRYKVSDTDKITLRTFTINFNITSKEAPLLVSAKVNDSDVEGGNVTEAQNTSGVICLAFDHPMVAKNVVINDKTFTATAVGDTVKLHYWALQPGTPYKFNLPAETFEDIYGAKCETPISLSFTTAASASVSATLFNYIVTHKIVWDSFTQEMKDTVQIVSDDVIENLAKQGDIEYGTLEEGLAKANAAGGANRYRIFVPDGKYNVRGISPLVSTDVTGNLWGKDLNGTPTKTVGLTMTDYKDHVFYNGRSILSSDNISIIGQSQDSTIIYSDPRVCGLYRSPIFSISNNVKGTYMQDFTLENRFCNSMGNQPDAYLVTNEKEETGGAPSIVDNGYHTVAKYVTLKAHDGTYVSSPVKGQQTDNYYEDCQLWGMHYPLLRTGQTWWQNPKVVLRYNSKRPARLSCIEHFSTQPWGYILKDGVFTAENAAARSKNENGFCLGTLVRNSPVQTLLNMKFDVASAAVGYNVRVQGGGEVIRFHEYGSESAASGVPVDLSTRSTSIFSPGAGSDDYVLTANQAAEYTIENMFGSDEAYDPRVHTAQVDLDGVVLSQTDDGITWNGNSQAICYFIFRQNPETGFFEFFDICLDDVYTPRDEADADGMVFYVRAANERGGLGKPSKTIKYKKLGWYDLKVVHKEGLAETGDTSDDWKGWSTICLARNAKVPTKSINEDGTFGKGKISVYAAQAKIDGTTIHMKKVEYLRAGCGYVVYATTGETEKTYRFNYTWDTNNLSTGDHDSFLDGNELDDTVSVGTVNCYTMAYKKTINPDCVGFYKFIGEKIPPHRAYLTVETAAAKGFVLDTEADAKKVRFVFDDSDEEFFFYEGDEDADGIRNVRSSEVDPEAVFDLSGKRLDKSQLRKGMVYVIGGKKVLWTGE